jgi:hypothetical protein
MQRQHKLTPSPTIAVLAQVDPLPDAQRQPTVLHRNHQRRSEQRGLDVSRHVVRTLQRMLVRKMLRHQGIDRRLEIGSHFRRSILVHRQRRRRVLKKQIQQPGFDRPQFRQRLQHLRCDQMKTASLLRQRQASLNPTVHENDPLACPVPVK